MLLTEKIKITIKRRLGFWSNNVSWEFVKQSNLFSSGSGRGRGGRGGGRGRGGRGGNRGGGPHKKDNLIVSSGIFSEGLSGADKTRGGRREESSDISEYSIYFWQNELFCL